MKDKLFFHSLKFVIERETNAISRHPRQDDTLFMFSGSNKSPYGTVRDRRRLLNESPHLYNFLFTGNLMASKEARIY